MCPTNRHILFYYTHLTICLTDVFIFLLGLLTFPSKETSDAYELDDSYASLYKFFDEYRNLTVSLRAFWLDITLISVCFIHIVL